MGQCEHLIKASVSMLESQEQCIVSSRSEFFFPKDGNNFEKNEWEKSVEMVLIKLKIIMTFVVLPSINIAYYSKLKLDEH